MPLIRISMLKGKPPEHIKAISASIHLALVDSFGMHPDDLFQTIEQCESWRGVAPCDFGRDLSHVPPLYRLRSGALLVPPKTARVFSDGVATLLP